MNIYAFRYKNKLNWTALSVTALSAEEAKDYVRTSYCDWEYMGLVKLVEETPAKQEPSNHRHKFKELTDTGYCDICGRERDNDIHIKEEPNWIDLTMQDCKERILNPETRPLPTPFTHHSPFEPWPRRKHHLMGMW